MTLLNRLKVQWDFRVAVRLDSFTVPLHNVDFARDSLRKTVEIPITATTLGLWSSLKSILRIHAKFTGRIQWYIDWLRRTKCPPPFIIEGIFKCFLEMSQEFVFQCPTDHNSSFIRVMVWPEQASRHYTNQWCPSSRIHNDHSGHGNSQWETTLHCKYRLLLAGSIPIIIPICVIGPQWFNVF